MPISMAATAHNPGRPIPVSAILKQGDKWASVWRCFLMCSRFAVRSIDAGAKHPRMALPTGQRLQEFN